MTTKTTDVFQVEHIEYVTDRPLDEVASALEGATGDLTDGKYASEVASAKGQGRLRSPRRRTRPAELCGLRQATLRKAHCHPRKPASCGFLRATVLPLQHSPDF